MNLLAIFLDIMPLCLRKNVTLDQFKEHTASDKDFKLLKMYVMHGWPSAQQDCVEQLRSYFTFKEEISFIGGLLFKGNRLICNNKTLYVYVAHCQWFPVVRV